MYNPLCSNDEAWTSTRKNDVHFEKMSITPGVNRKFQAIWEVIHQGGGGGGIDQGVIHEAPKFSKILNGNYCVMSM